MQVINGPDWSSEVPIGTFKELNGLKRKPLRYLLLDKVTFDEHIDVL